MYYKNKNILCTAALTLALSMANVSLTQAQGIVSLSNDDGAEMDPALNKDIPDEISLFEETLETIEPKEEQLISPVQKNYVAQISKEEREARMSKSAEQKSEKAEEYAPMALPTQPTERTNPLMNNFSGGLGALAASNSEINDTVFSQMSALEKQTALLNLELRREKVKNDIEAMKNQRIQAIEQEQDRKDDKLRKKIEWEKAQEQKIIQEQQKLRELDLAFEKLRQEKLLKSYKNQMLEDNQKWITHNASLYKEMADLRDSKAKILEDSKQKLEKINATANGVKDQVLEARNVYERDIADLQTQISILKSRIEAQEREMEKQNPFAEENVENAQAGMANPGVIAKAEEEKIVKLSDLYAVMEIRGQGGELIAKLINQDGAPFYVKKGTALQTGHIIDEITSSYLRADKAGTKDFLYFSAGGILSQEPIKSDISPAATLKDAVGEKVEKTREFVSSDGIPGLGKDMMIR